MDKFVPAVGKARRSQGVFGFGPGAIVDFPGGSFMPLGLHQMEMLWSDLPVEAKSDIAFHEPRLQRLLEVDFFRKLPTPGEGFLGEYGRTVHKNWGTPCVRFPRWLECPQCHRLGFVGEPFEARPNGEVVCLKCDTKHGLRVNPVRFVVACHRGHIDDFPWNEWAHSKATPCERPNLSMRSEGRSAALGDLRVECRCGATRGLGDIFQGKEMKPYRCRGSRPWMQLSEKCGGDLVTLQRGASNVHFSVTASMLSIPPASESISKLLEPEWALLKHLPDVAIRPTLEGFIKSKGWLVDPAAATEWVLLRKGIDTDPQGADERSARLQEYESLSHNCAPKPHETDPSDFENELIPVPPGIDEWFDTVSAVHRLREVRVACGFTRLDPVSLDVEDIAEALRQRRICPLSAGPVNWRPGIEVRGEGIFFRLREKAISDWLKDNDAIEERAAEIDGIFAIKSDRDGIEPPYAITPRLLLVHAFAHLLLRRFSLDCGYSTASLRERLYIGEPGDAPAMAGVLIYTASTDSDGSLGGLVNLARPDNIASLVHRSVRDAEWCGSDPVCSETNPRERGNRLSGAACHNCLLVPETACERFNRELDRAMLVGTPNGAIRGFFHDLDAHRR